MLCGSSGRGSPEFLLPAGPSDPSPLGPAVGSQGAAGNRRPFMVKTCRPPVNLSGTASIYDPLLLSRRLASGASVAKAETTPWIATNELRSGATVSGAQAIVARATSLLPATIAVDTIAVRARTAALPIFADPFATALTRQPLSADLSSAQGSTCWWCAAASCRSVLSADGTVQYAVRHTPAAHQRAFHRLRKTF